MKLMSFPEILDCENGQQITALQGTVKKVFPPKTGVGDYGPWSLQNLILQDEHAHELTVTWTCEDAFDAGVEGQTLYFESGRDKKDQLAGIKREIKNKNGKKYESVKVDDRAKVKILNRKTAKTANIPKADQEADAERMFPDPDWPDASCETSVKQEAPATPPESSVRPQNGNGGVTDARKHLCQAANLYNLCVKCVDAMIAPNVPNIAQTSEQFQAAVGTLFIEASRAGYVQKMPETPLK